MAKAVMRYNEVFSPKVTAGQAFFAPYDALYLLAYAVVAGGGEPVTGPGLARAIQRLLPPGETVDVGPGGIYRALHALQAGKNIDLNGTTTSLDFDLETGDATANFVVYCLAGAGRADGRIMLESGLVFNARTGKLEGTLKCP